MAKLLLLIVLVGLVLLAWKTLAGIARARDAAARRRADEAGASGASSASGAARPVADEPMLRCAHCGVHFPASEVVAGGGLPFCSASHRDAGPRGG